MSASVPSKPYPRIRRIVRGWVDGLTRIGVQGQFYFQTLVSIREAFALQRGDGAADRPNEFGHRRVGHHRWFGGNRRLLDPVHRRAGCGCWLQRVRLLEDAGLVSRTTGSADARAVRISITAKGHSVLAQVHADCGAATDRCLARLDDADRQTLAEAVRVMRGLLDDA
jgi:hypothetical protein